MEHTTSTDSVSVLNSFLRGELSAVETYRQALDKIADPTPRATLEECLHSHEQRVAVLRRRVQALGGEPSSSSGPWGTFAKLVEGSAKIFGDKAAIAALEEGEDHGRDDYRSDLDKLDPDSRQLLQAQVVPEQQRTHRAMSTLKHSLSS